MKAYEIQTNTPMIAPIGGNAAGAANTAALTTGERFSEVLERLGTREVRFSKHAGTRLNARDIRFTDDQMTRLNQGVRDAGAKGIIDGLLLMDGVALVVNVPSATVVTAMDGQERGVFTNIDGAVIV